MSEWVDVTLKDVISLIRNGCTSTQDDSVTKYPVTRIETISDGCINMARVKYLQNDEPNYRLEKGDILYSHINSFSHVGKVALVVDDTQLYHGMNLLLIRANKNIIDTYFLYSILHSENGRAHARRECRSAINQVSLGQGDIGRLQISLPSYPEQRKIAKILSTVDNLIEKTQALIDKYQSIKQGMMHDLFTRGVDENGQLRPSYEEAPHLYKESELGWIPKEWEVVSIAEIAHVLRGASPRPQGDPRYYGGDVPRLMVADVTRDGKYVTPCIDFLTSEGAKRSRPMPKGALTIVCSGTVGIPSILNVDACIHDGFLALDSISSGVELDYLYQYFAKSQSLFDSSATHGGIFTNLTTSILKEFRLALPSSVEQVAISKRVDQLESKLSTEKLYLAKLLILKSGLMQDLLTCKVRVKVDA